MDTDDDELDNLSRFQYPKSRTEQKPRYQYVNSEKDLHLPLQKHKNIQPFYESPEEGMLSCVLFDY